MRSAPSAGTEAAAAQLLVLGLGNPLMGDDGLGHAVVGHLEQRTLPPGLRLLRIDGDVLGLAELWRGEAAVWMVDAVQGPVPAGSLHVSEHEELLEMPTTGQFCHHPDLGESLRWLRHAYSELAVVRFRLFGIAVDAVRPEIGLSPAIEEGAGRVADAIQTAAGEFFTAI